MTEAGTRTSMEEATPFLSESPPPSKSPPPPTPAKEVAVDSGWTADGIPVPAGVPAERYRWGSGLCNCLGRNDEFFSSDLEVCLLGCFAPCVLYGANVERLGAGQESFANNCFMYTGLYVLGNSLFGWNFLAPWFTYHTRTAIRHRFNLEGTYQSFSRSFCCCKAGLKDDMRQEHMETICDLATHLCCQPCAMCQEGRELRRRLPHPGFNRPPFFVGAPPVEQTMNRGI